MVFGLRNTNENADTDGQRGFETKGIFSRPNKKTKIKKRTKGQKD